ncbi:MAG: lipopolysaccharide biosynthesis protein, partial [Pseudomonadota bacterium]
MTTLDTQESATNSFVRLTAKVASMLPEPLAKKLSGLLNNADDLASVLRGAASVMAIRVAGACVSFISLALLARWMGAFEFGIYAYVWTWIIFVGTMAPLGLNTSLMRFIPEYMARQRWGRIWGLLTQAHLIVLAASTAVSVIGGIILWIVQPYIDDYYVLPFAVALLVLPLYALLDTQEGTARAFGWVTLAYIIPYLMRPLLLLLGIGALVLVGLAPDAIDALLAMAAACVIGISVQAVVLVRSIRATVPRAKPRTHAGYWLMISMPMLVFEGAYLLMSSTDVIMLGQIEDPASVAIYYAAARTASLIGFVYFATTARTVPKFAEINASGSREDLQKFLDGVNRVSFWPSFMGVLVLLVIGQYILGLFGDGFEDGYLIL